MKIKALVSALLVAVAMTLAVQAHAQLPLFDGLDWVMDRGANTFAPVTGTINGVAGAAPVGIPFRQGTSAFNQRFPLVGNPDSTSLVNNDPWRAVRRSVWPRTADLTIQGLLQTEIIDNPNNNDPDNDTDTGGNQVRVQPRQIGAILPIDSAHAYLLGGAWTPAPNVVPGSTVPQDYRSPAGGFSFSSDPTQVYTQDYAYADAIHNDFLVNRPGANDSPATSGELAALPYVDSEVYSAVEKVLKNTATATAVWQLGNYFNTPARFTIDLYSPGDGTVVVNRAYPNATRAFVRVSYGHRPTVADPNDVQTVNPAGQQIKAGVEDSRYSRIFLIDLGQSGWISITPGGRPASAFDYNGDPRYQIVVTLYTLTPDDVNDLTLFGSIPPKIPADAIRFNPQATAVNTPGLSQTADGQPISAVNPATYSIAPTGRIISSVVGTNKFTNPPFSAPNFDVTANDAQPLIYVAREEGVPNTTPIIPFDPTQPASTTNPLVADTTLNITAPVFYCIDNKNSNATKIIGMNPPVPTVSVDRVRWRYVGLPDTNSGSGTASASPLLANVRCRDGAVRSILYFVTTNAVGGVGHIYALDPLGNRQDLVTSLNLNTTAAYWVYPSYRPLTSAEILLAQFPDQYHDPNYNASAPYTTGVAALDGLETRQASGAFTTAPPWGADQMSGAEKNYVDGDIIANPALAGHLILRADTQVPFTGVQSSPMVIDDAENPLGAQLLIVGGMNGRVYCLDAGGRGDFVYDKTLQNDAINPATGIPFSVPGTSQRYWTWPHFRGDAFHAQNGSGAAAPGLNLINNIADETGKISFPSSPACEVITGNLSTPFYIGGGDGHMFALFSKHDKYLGLGGNNVARFEERRSWVYPNSPTSSQDTQTLGAAPSTPAIFTPLGGVQPYLYFTCAGRVYCLLAHPVLNGTPTFIPNTAPTGGAGSGWVFPFTNNPPFPNPNDTFSARLFPGFQGTAPTLISAAALNVAPPTAISPLVTNDLCYVVQGDGTVYALNAYTGALNAVGQSFSGGSTRCSAIATRLTGLLGFWDDTTNSQPSLVFADDDGAIWGVAARPSTTIIDLNNPAIALLPTIWGHFDSSNSRPAPASLANAMIYEGGEDGQLRAYGIGGGINGLDTTLDAGEPAESGFGISPSGISIDLRGLNLYTAADYNAMTRANPTRTPARTATNGAFANTVNPIVGTIDPNNGSADKTTWPALVDWGDSLYVAGYGVYHAQRQDFQDGTRGASPPAIQVQLTISQPGQPSINVTVSPAFTSNVGGATWPDDRAITAGEHNAVSIYGIDDPSGDGTPPARIEPPNSSGERLVGPDKGVLPYTFFYRIPILPDGTKPFTPGTSGYRVTARAVLTQNVTNTPGNMGTQSYSESSNFLQLGQRDYSGLTPAMGDNTIASVTNPVVPTNPNQLNKIGRRRDVIITNPIGVTVRSYTPAGGGSADMTTGNQPNVIGLGPAAAIIGNPFEVTGNGNRIANPYAAAGSTAAPIKALFAPITMTSHGSSNTYAAVLNNGQKTFDAFNIADRSNMAFTGAGGAARHLRVRVLSKPNHWLGGNTSVMNPLPWDLMPNDAQDTRDYPNLPLNSLDIVSATTGQDAINGTISLTQPLYDASNNPDTRVVRPTPLKMTVRVPKFQPANVNRGVKTWKLADGTSFTFGSAYTDIAGNVTGNGGATGEITGPLNVTTGAPINIASGLAYPAGGYVGELIVEAVPGGAATFARLFNPASAFNDSTREGASEVTQAYRALEIGTTVPPSVKMRVVEQTVDLGKLPHGAGYSDLTNSNPPDFRFPFSPSVDPFWRNNAAWAKISPWDEANLLGDYFRPFTLVNESNVNLYDVRIGKLMGDAPWVPNNIPTPLALTSDQTNASIMAPPYLGPANRQARGIGIVSSFDHISRIRQNGNGIFPERPVWPMLNPYVDLAGITEAKNSGLQTTVALNAGLLPWTAGIQPQPTVHKARVGDSGGTIATIPDTPYDAVSILNFTPQQTKISLAVPLGTPVGSYSAPVYPFEDNVPLQWQEWLASSNGFGSTGSGGFVDTSHDGLINSVANASGARTPIEPFSDPTFALKVNVREARITGGVTRGTLAQVDTFLQGLLSPNPFDNNNNVNPDIQMPPFGPNMLPAAMFHPTGNNNFEIDLYWATPRQPNNSPFVTAAGPRTGQPVADAPWSIAYSALFEGVGGWTFGKAGTNNFANAAWWGVGNGNTFGLFPGYDGAGQPASLAALFPSTPNEASTYNVPYVPGTRMNRTVRYASPAAAVRTFAGAPSNYPTAAQLGYLFWQGVVDKQRGTGSQFTESRTFYAPVQTNSNGQPDGANIRSFLNDPALSKLSPKPLLLNSNGNDIMYLFWHAGSGQQTQLYYNDNTTANFPAAAWNRDTRLETPEALAWQSDPSPIYHQAWDTVNNKAMDVIDIVYTGVLKNRRNVETMLSRYQINPDFSLSITGLPEVVGEQMSRTGTTFSYAARDAAWAYGTGPQGQLLPTDRESRIKLYISRNYAAPIPLVPANKGFFTDAQGDHFPIGRHDPASGLIYYDSILGGQIVVDPRSGTVSFPQVAPGRNDAIFVNYTPLVMRLNTSRDETNIVRTAGYGNFTANDRAFEQRSASVSPGSNQNPVAIIERDFNERVNLTSPRVVFPANTGAAFPRLWVLYRKTDVSGAVRSTIYYKAMRLLARLPRPVALTNNNGNYSITNLTVSANAGPYEVDWVRGRVYFTELAEGQTVTINYTYVGGQSGNLVYRVAWGDEISATSLPADPAQPFVDHTTPEVVLPTDSAVNEGQVTAFQIPASLRTGPAASGQPYQPVQGSELWVFWTSTRAGTTDLFYETIRPNFYPNATNQR